MVGFTYKSYSFIDKDPIIDVVRTVIKDSGKSFKEIQALSGVGRHTISDWIYGETKRPQAASINAVLRALGYKLDAVPMNYRGLPPTPKNQIFPTRHILDKRVN